MKKFIVVLVFGLVVFFSLKSFALNRYTSIHLDAIGTSDEKITADGFHQVVNADGNLVDSGGQVHYVYAADDLASLFTDAYNLNAWKEDIIENLISNKMQ